MTPASIDDFRELARRRLPRFLFDYIDGGSYAETTLRANVDDLQRLKLRQQVMRDVSNINVATTLLRQPASFPVALAPVGLAGLYARRGEVQAARAAQAAGVPFILSSSACCSIEEVVQGTGRPVCLQLYMIRDRGFMADLLARTAALGVETLMLTVDLIVHSPRRRDVRSSLTGTQGFAARTQRAWEIARHPDWAWDVGVRGRPHTLGNFAPMMPNGAGLAQFTAWVGRNFDPSITWKDIEWLRQHWHGPIVVKGVMDAENAVAACDAGMEAIVVSNHGGRQLDGAPSTIAALPGIVAAVDGRADVLMDGGIRSGIDILRAMALGAKGVLLGRAWAFALAAQRGAGVTRMLGLLKHELEVAMALTGQTDVRALEPDILLPSR
ncbi:L-lactate dehydrogenase [Sphingomonas nostoxanthinifaciens]|uniref:L-lactate dehydrogenase n=1 Tax=Sphingomonas nostoxanthinifaciens TaxID=2872652 RepID=UPI001CC1EDD7|nr:L-lactate dehydrogenase [Sphingomonas nostoxanthinifaciens]UAK23277.1 L-lactate dehydrogenase [Sphingomonas nostoxanthinifaciens]